MLPNGLELRWNVAIPSGTGFLLVRRKLKLPLHQNCGLGHKHSVESEKKNLCHGGRYCEGDFEIPCQAGVCSLSFRCQSSAGLRRDLNRRPSAAMVSTMP